MPKQEFLTPAVGEQTYNSFSLDQKNLFDLVVSCGGGVTSAEIKKQINLDHKFQERIVREILQKGVAIRALKTGVGLRYIYSPYAEDHDKRTNGGNRS